MAAVSKARVDLDRFDDTLLCAYAQVRGDTHAERSGKAEVLLIARRNLGNQEMGDAALATGRECVQRAE